MKWGFLKMANILNTFTVYCNLIKQYWDNIKMMLQTQVLRDRQVNKPCIGLIQENLIENSVLDCLLYIINYHGSCYYSSSLP